MTFVVDGGVGNRASILRTSAAIVSSRCSMDQPWTVDSVARILINPNYCLTDPPVVTEEKWIEANAKLVQKMGVEPYLATLLSVLRAGSK
jgi:uncharacterized protein (DUF362 family)